MKKVCRIFEKLGLFFVLFAMVACSSYVNDIRVSVNEIEVTFSVEHWKQTVDGKTYELDKNATQSLKGMSMDTTKAKAADFEGFTAQKIDQKTIQRDGSTVVRVYYDRTTITYTFSPAGGNWNGSTDDITVSGLYGAAVPIPDDPAKAGYTFCEWSERIPEVFGAQNLSFTGQWTAGTGTRYKVEHWFQNVSGNGYDLDDTQSENKVGTTQTQTNAQPKYCDGFTGQTITQSLIAADGSTVVKVYYNRNTITYTFNPAGGNWNGSTANITVSGLYGAPVILPALPQKQGYDFNDWDEAVPEAFGAQDLSFIGQWNPGTDTHYEVWYFFQTISGDDYVIDSTKTENKTGTTDADTFIEAGVYPGFTAQDVEQKKILADGTTVVNIYYDRKTIQYTFNANDGLFNDDTTSKIVSGVFGATIAVPESPKANHILQVFEKWQDNVPQTFGSENKTFSAKYKTTLYEEVTLLPDGTDGSFGPEGKYAYFGVWPRTIKPQDVTIDETQYIIIGENTYYLGNDGNYYMGCIENKFSYRYTDPEIFYSDGTPVQKLSANSTQYFQVEPIKWRILTNDYNGTGDSLLLAEDILFGSTIIFSSGGFFKTSTIRTWLNESFYNNAFTQNAKTRISTTSVENTLRSSFPCDSRYDDRPGESEYYYSEETNDKVFILSMYEATNPEYGFTAEYQCSDEDNKPRIRIPTDYAVANFTVNKTSWWLRSTVYTGYFGSKILVVSTIGECDLNTWSFLYLPGPNLSSQGRMSNGVVPAITVALQ